jgi:hypothetical protein
MLQQHQRTAVMDVWSLALHLLVSAFEQYHHLTSAVAAILPKRDATLRLAKLPFGLAVMTGVLDDLPISRDETYLESHIRAGLTTSGRQGLEGHLHTRETGIPPVGLAADRDHLECALPCPVTRLSSP